MAGETGVIRGIIDELRPLDMQGDQMEGESSFTGSIIVELHSSEIQ